MGEPATRAQQQRLPEAELEPAADARTALPFASKPLASAATTRVLERPAAASAEDAPDPRAELVMIQRMHAALRKADSTRVLALCAEHQKLWPHGTFVQEREGLRTIAECQADIKNADVRARRFFADFPHSPMEQRIRETCAAQLKASVF